MINQLDQLMLWLCSMISVCGDDRKCKNKADRKMVKSLDAIPYKDIQWGHWLARTMINTKQKLGMGTKNVKRR